ncbi:MAG: alpha-ketoacid dehydrogenase subunit beta [candidate division WOR-3 bacterium]|nr:alpha-ketoacid dehydrogenase subunit beta [candidate division WOR-3 bacterium]MCX7947684.1 alpha-ketoacid dehydrogenase subunit beta [candidate division WOR-3 bacterium]MDW8150561.1 alpha-ketoacid dehydrogenase subunit beta [candidate division WOR-3 bacterium]
MVFKLEEGEKAKSAKAITIVKAIREALAEEMRRDSRVVILGEDVGKRGGVFLATEGLIDEFGEERVIDTPLTELGIIGVAVGMALYGLRPVAEIQFIDFVYPGFDQIVNEAAKFRYRSGGQYSVPLVIRSPYGGGIGGGLYHSQSPESYFTHTPGLKVIIPSTPTDAKGLLKSAIRDEDPVIFLEPKKIYMSIKEEVPDDIDFTIEIGKAKKIKEGKDVTLISYGYMVHVCMKAVEIAQKEGISVELIDLRTLLPFDKDAILESVAKTGRLVIVNEAPKIGSFASEISAFVSERAIEYLLAPIKRITGFDTPFPYAQQKYYMPNEYRIYKAIKEVMEWN